MKLTKRQLTQIIAEALLIEQEDKKFLGFDEVPGNPKALKFKTPMPGPIKKVFEKLKKELSSAKLDPENYYLAKSYYDKYVSKGTPGVFGATGPSLGISGKGDPYTYKPLSGGKVLVVSGPNPKAVGKTFTPKKKIKDKEPDKLTATEAEFIVVKNFQDFGDKIRTNREKFGLESDYSTTSSSNVVNAPAAKAAVKESKAGNIGMSDVKDALVEVADGLGLEVLMTAFASTGMKKPDAAAGGKFEIFIAYRSKDIPNQVVIEQTGEFETTSGGETSYVKPDSSSDNSSEPLSEGLSRGSLYRRRYWGRY